MSDTHDPGAKRGFGAGWPDRPARSEATFPSSCSTSSLRPSRTSCSSGSASTSPFPRATGTSSGSSCPSRAWSASVPCGRGAATAARGVTPASTRPSGCSRRAPAPASSCSSCSCGATSASRSRCWSRVRSSSTFLFGMVRFQQRLFAFRRSSYCGHRHAGRGGRRRHQRRRGAPRDAAVANARAHARGRGRRQPGAAQPLDPRRAHRRAASTSSPRSSSDHDVHLILLRDAVGTAASRRSRWPTPPRPRAIPVRVLPRVVVVGARHAPAPRR